jgi:endonuclease YncB( thermonuclease family)
MKTRLLSFFYAVTFLTLSVSAVAGEIYFEGDGLDEFKALSQTAEGLTLEASFKDYGDVLVSRVTAINSAQHLIVNIDAYPPIIGKKVPVLISGIVVPQLHAQCDGERRKARIAKEYVMDAIHSAKVVELKNIERAETFGLLADVYLDDINLTDRLLKSGYASKQDGSHVVSWCEVRP